MKHIGNELEKIISRKMIKKKDFAKQIGMSDVNLSKIFKKNSINADLLEKIANNLDIPVSYFFDDKQNNTITNNNNNTRIGDINQNQNINSHVNEIENLRKEIAACKELLKAKDEIIILLKSK